jgi:hypothetical protein
MKYSKPWIEVHGEKTDELNTKIDVKRERIKKVCSYSRNGKAPVMRSIVSFS